MEILIISNMESKMKYREMTDKHCICPGELTNIINKVWFPGFCALEVWKRQKEVLNTQNNRDIYRVARANTEICTRIIKLALGLRVFECTISSWMHLYKFFPKKKIFSEKKIFRKGWYLLKICSNAQNILVSAKWYQIEITKHNKSWK